MKIDRVKLREIAMKNAYAAVHAGRSLTTLQPDQIAALKAGGKSLNELTDFCKQITEKEALRAAGHISDDDEPEPPGTTTDEPVFINHPFAVKEPTNMEIAMRIKVRFATVTSSVKKFRRADVALFSFDCRTPSRFR